MPVSATDVPPKSSALSSKFVERSVKSNEDCIV